MTDEILTFEEVRKYLKISRSKLYQLAQQNKIPVSKIGRTWRFKKSKIDTWLDREDGAKNG
jgi:excisionase family DNA binding protein